ncbi:MAG: 16S rRNA (guanine(527)-N(7))-methyltransferase RsmG [Pseudomonadales bacterium]|nr:16S rRNA (guanine(527)-N(7))-methyltransferase RsmG [Pseudomonadales bacterium]
MSAVAPEGLEARLGRGLAAVGAPADDRAVDALSGWLALHARWSRAFNLTGTRDPVELVDRHLLDAAAVVPLLPPGSIADVGSGAGLPGLVVALLEPERPVTLVDSLAKRTRFLEEAVRVLGVRNVRIVTRRIEAWAVDPGSLPAAVLARAVAPLPRLAALLAPLLSRGVRLLAMKGPGWAEEAEGLGPQWAITSVREYVLPADASTRTLVTVCARGEEEP